jgi:hypothetical protein
MGDSAAVRRRLRALSNLVMVSAVLSGLLAACSGGANTSSSTSVASPTPDSAAYVALIHNYWIQYKTAEGDLDHIGNNSGPFSNGDAAKACGGLSSPGTFSDLSVVDPATCGSRATAMVAVHEKFLGDLANTAAPQKFAADDQAFRTHLPKAIADVKAMIVAAGTGSKDAVLQATNAYVNDMIPKVTGALDHVDPSVTHI